MPRVSDAKQKAIETAERLFQTQGYAATGLTQIIEESGAPKGSFYFHFPDGKRQLALAALAFYRERTCAGFRMLAERAGADGNRFVRSLTKALVQEMRDTGWTAGCLAQSLSLELAPGDTEVADALTSLFDEWQAIIAAALTGSATAASKARALTLIAGMQGARTLARAQRSGAPFDAVAALFISRTKS